MLHDTAYRSWISGLCEKGDHRLLMIGPDLNFLVIQNRAAFLIIEVSHCSSTFPSIPTTESDCQSAG